MVAQKVVEVLAAGDEELWIPVRIDGERSGARGGKDDWDEGHIMLRFIGEGMAGGVDHVWRF